MLCRSSTVRRLDGGHLFVIRRAPEMFDHRQLVSAFADDLCNPRAEPGEPVDQRRHAADHSAGIAEQPGGQMPRVHRQFDGIDGVRDAGRKFDALAGLAEDNHIHAVAPRQILQQRCGAQGAAAGGRIGRFGSEEQGSIQSAALPPRTPPGSGGRCGSRKTAARAPVPAAANRPRSSGCVSTAVMACARARDVAGRHAHSRVTGHFSQGRISRRDHARSALHGLEHRQAESLVA